MIIEYRGCIIRDKHLNGCLINGRLFIPNGTGPTNKPWLAWALKKLLIEEYISEYSKAHDIMYKIGGNKEDRKRADVIYRKLINGAINKLHKWYKKAYYYSWSWIIYNSLRIGGKSSFNWASEFSLIQFL